MAYTTVDRTAYNALVDDSGGGTDGSVWDKADVADILNAIDALFSSATGLKCNGPLLERNRAANVGEWTSVTFAAGNFTGSGAMTWTLDSADQTTLAYMLVGKTLWVSFNLGNTTVGGTVNISLQIAIPGGFTATKQMVAPILISDNGGTQVAGYAVVVASGNNILCRKMDNANWTLATNTTNVSGLIAFEVN